MGMFWDTMRLLEGQYRRAVKEHKLDYAEGLHDAMQKFDDLKPVEWISTENAMPTGDLEGVQVWIWDGKNVSLDNYKRSRRNYGHVVEKTGKVVPTTGWWRHYVADEDNLPVLYWMPIKKPDRPQEANNEKEVQSNG